MEKTNSPLTEYLQKMIQNHPNTIEHDVAAWLLTHNNPETGLRHLLEYGCAQGTVPDLTYYHQTYAFFDKHYKQIIDIYFEHNLMVPAQTDVKNYLAWKSFELVARIISNSAHIFY